MDIEKYLAKYKLGRPVLEASGTPGSFDSRAVDAPFVFWHNGRWRMMYVGFDGIRYQTGIAVSDDLLHWEKEGMLFADKTPGRWDSVGIAGIWMLREQELFARPILQKYKDKYWMVYHSYPEEGYEQGPANIGLAYTTDENLMEWNRLDMPILSWKDGAAWERYGLYKGCIVKHDKQFLMYYNAKDGDLWNWHEQIGMAASKDLLYWERYAENPLICNKSGGWERWFAADPCVLRDGDTWLMYYYGYDGVHAREGLAVSTDLIHWDRYALPILDVGEPGSIDHYHAHKPSVIFHNGTLYHFYCAVRESLPGDRSVNIDPTKPENAAAKEFRCLTVAASKPFSL
jgi:predicted GH43/DUF377 family glycosyl hydrolase